MVCSKCGAEIPEGQEACVVCLTAIARPGLLTRFFHWFRLAASPPTTARRSTVRVVIRGATTGKQKVLRSLADVPPDIRAKIEDTLAGIRESSVVRTFTVRDAAGREQTYRSADEMPPAIRAAYERSLVLKRNPPISA